MTKGPSFAITGPTGLTAGTAGTFTLTALNANGTLNTGYSGTVQITSSDPKAVLPGNVAISGGTGTFNVTLETAGTQSITATDVNNSSLTGYDTSIAVRPGAASQVVFTEGLPAAPRDKPSVPLRRPRGCLRQRRDRRQQRQGDAQRQHAGRARNWAAR